MRVETASLVPFFCEPFFQKFLKISQCLTNAHRNTMRRFSAAIFKSWNLQRTANFSSAEKGKIDVTCFL
jgi:hypothetical protein